MCAGDPVLRLCPAGHYCDGIPGSDFPSGAGPRPCPPYTYRASPGAGSKGDCLPCPPGSHCNSAGVKHGISRRSRAGPQMSACAAKWKFSGVRALIYPPARTSSSSACNKVGWLHTIKAITVCYTKSALMRMCSLFPSVFYPFPFSLV